MARVASSPAWLPTQASSIPSPSRARSAAAIASPAEVSSSVIEPMEQAISGVSGIDEISARTDYRRARVELARATGSLIEERGIESNEATREGGTR